MSGLTTNVTSGFSLEAKREKSIGKCKQVIRLVKTEPSGPADHNSVKTYSSYQMLLLL
jgi:hypothetical protein